MPVPLVVGYMTGTNENNTKRAFKISLVFSLGMAITYTALGVAAALLSKIFSQSGKWWDIFLGLLMVLMALQTWEIRRSVEHTFVFYLHLIVQNRRDFSAYFSQNILFNNNQGGA